jgi:hypothetical protein
MKYIGTSRTLKGGEFYPEENARNEEEAPAQ